MEKIIVNAEKALFGRMASFVAKELLKGNSVEVINAEKVLFSGDIKVLTEKIRHKQNMGRGASMKGPKYIRREDLLLKRMIRGMLPRDKAKGREAYKRLRCYKGEQQTDTTNTTIKTFDVKLPRKYATAKEIVLRLGGTHA